MKRGAEAADRKILALLDPGGYLFVGHAESLFGLSQKFKMVHENTARLPENGGDHVTRPPEERSTELRTLFFESASELLQALNEAGLELESHPADEEIIRRVRRCGAHAEGRFSGMSVFTSLSELAHELEDVLTPQLASSGGPKTRGSRARSRGHIRSDAVGYQRDAELPSVESVARCDQVIVGGPERDRRKAGNRGNSGRDSNGRNTSS